MRHIEKKIGFVDRRVPYVRNESGSLTIFSLFIFLLIIMIAGMAVDLAIHERERVRLQNTLDTAVVAAASATQGADRNEVIEDYIEKAGFDRSSVIYDVTSNDGRSVAVAAAPTQTGTLFMRLLGIDTLRSGAVAEASEVVTGIEISLVLDFTSSMRSNGRREALVASVKDFVNVVFELDCDSAGNNCVAPDDIPDISINVIPYGGTVNPGPQMASILGLQRWHNYTSCGVIPQADYANTELPNPEMQYPHYYIWHRENLAVNQAFGWCPQDQNTIQYAETDPEAIKTYVANLNLNDGTGSDIGHKWGMALLDPTSRDEINQLIDAGVVTGNISRTFPKDHAPNVLKVAIVMTDGGITSQRLPPEFDFAHLYEDGALIAPNLGAEDPNLDATLPFHAEREVIFDRRGSEDVDGAPRDVTEIEFEVAGNANDRTGSELIQQDQAILNFTAQCGLGKLQFPDGDGGTKDAVSIYTVRFLETAQYTEDYLKPCATTEGQYFDVQSVAGLRGAFGIIAQHINNQVLRLTN